MAKNQVHVAMSAANAQIVRAWLQANKGPQQMLGLLKQIGAQGQATGAKVSSGMGRINTSLIRAMGTFIGIGTAISAIGTAAGIVRGEWEQLKSVQKETAGKTIPFSRAVNRLRKLGLPPHLAGMAEQLGQRALGIKTPIPADQRVDIISEAISAGTKPKRPDVESRAEMALLIMERFGEELKDDTVALAEFARTATVVKDTFPKEKPEAIIQSLGPALVASPGGTKKLAEFMDNIIRQTVVRLASKGFSFREAVALTTGIQSAAQDVEGASTRTTVNKNVEMLMRTLRGEVETAGIAETGGMAMFRFIRKQDTELQRQLSARILRGESLLVQRMARERGVTPADILKEMGITGSLKSIIEGREKVRGPQVEFFQPEGAVLGPGNVQERVQNAADTILEGAEAIADAAKRQEEAAASLMGLPAALDSVLSQYKETATISTPASTREQMTNAIRDAGRLSGQSALMTGMHEFVQRFSTRGLSPEETMQHTIRRLRRMLNNLVFTAPDEKGEQQRRRLTDEQMKDSMELRALIAGIEERLKGITEFALPGGRQGAVRDNVPLPPGREHSREIAARENRIKQLDEDSRSLKAFSDAIDHATGRLLFGPGYQGKPSRIDLQNRQAGGAGILVQPPIDNPARTPATEIEGQ